MKKTLKNEISQIRKMMGLNEEVQNKESVEVFYGTVDTDGHDIKYEVHKKGDEFDWDSSKIVFNGKEVTDMKNFVAAGLTDAIIEDIEGTEYDPLSQEELDMPIDRESSTPNIEYPELGKSDDDEEEDLPML
jgi:hypothetical protein